MKIIKHAVLVLTFSAFTLNSNVFFTLTTKNRFIKGMSGLAGKGQYEGSSMFGSRWADRLRGTQEAQLPGDILSPIKRGLENLRADLN